MDNLGQPVLPVLRDLLGMPDKRGQLVKQGLLVSWAAQDPLDLLDRRDLVGHLEHPDPLGSVGPLEELVQLAVLVPQEVLVP